MAEGQTLASLKPYWNSLVSKYGYILARVSKKSYAKVHKAVEYIFIRHALVPSYFIF